MLLAVSVREGSDWVDSQAFRAERLSKSHQNVSSCESVDYTRSTCEKYRFYLPTYKSEGQAWWVIRHETVVEDTCAMLKQLKLECPTERAIGQRSRVEIQSKMDCKRPDMKREIDCINDLNANIFRRAVTH